MTVLQSAGLIRTRVHPVFFRGRIAVTPVPDQKVKHQWEEVSVLIVHPEAAGLLLSDWEEKPLLTDVFLLIPGNLPTIVDVTIAIIQNPVISTVTDTKIVAIMTGMTKNTRDIAGLAVIILEDIIVAPTTEGITTITPIVNGMTVSDGEFPTLTTIFSSILAPIMTGLPTGPDHGGVDFTGRMIISASVYPQIIIPAEPGFPVTGTRFTTRLNT